MIFLTAYSEFSYAQSALKLLASDYLLKPFGDGELEQAVNNALEKRKRTQEKLENSKEEPLPELVLNKGDKSKYVMAAVDYISAHYGDPELGVAEIAEHLGISEGHLSHTFKRETDYTVAAYITRVRMRTAMKLLNDCRNKVYAELDAFSAAQVQGSFQQTSQMAAMGAFNGPVNLIRTFMMFICVHCWNI